jgi:hypothetical protein
LHVTNKVRKDIWNTLKVNPACPILFITKYFEARHMPLYVSTRTPMGHSP